MQKHKRNVSESTKKQVAAAQLWKCRDCAEVLSAFYEVDHIVGLWRGGDNNIANLQALCRECHARKGAREREEEARFREAKLVFDRFFQPASNTFYTPLSMVLHVLKTHGGLSDADVTMLGLEVSRETIVFPGFLWGETLRRVGCCEVPVDRGVRAKLRPESLRMVEAERAMKQLKASEREKKARLASAFDQFRYVPSKRA